MIDDNIHPISRSPDSPPCIRHLLALGRPATVCCRITKVVVDALKICSCWLGLKSLIKPIEAIRRPEQKVQFPYAPGFLMETSSLPPHLAFISCHDRYSREFAMPCVLRGLQVLHQLIRRFFIA
jgi:hypothetical protein